MRHKVLTLVSLIVLLAMLMIGCAPAATPSPAATSAPAPTSAPAETAGPAGSPAASPAAAAPQNKEPIKIGLIEGLSTPWGLSEKTALEIAVEELNESGGILGRPVELVIEDSKGQVPLIVAAYKKLVMTDKCLLVLTGGTEGTSACVPEALQLFSEYPHLQFAIHTAHDGITDMVCEDHDKYRFLFRLHAKTTDLLDPNLGIWTFFTETLGTKKLALVIEEIGWTEPYVKGKPGKYPPLKEFFEEKGIEVVYYSKSAIGEKMFLPMLEEIAASGADTIYWPIGYTDGVTLAKQWSQSAAKDLDIVGSAGAPCYASFLEMTGGAGLGFITAFPEIEIPYTDKSVPFLRELKARGAGLVDSTAASYDSPWVLKAAVEKAGGTEDIEALIKAVETVEVANGFHIWKFDECHDGLKGYPYMPQVYGQHQGADKYVVTWPEKIREMTNPNDHLIRVKDLRSQAGQ